MNIQETKEYQEYVLRQKEKQKAIKSGIDVMHFSYYGNIITKEDLSDFENELERINLKLSSYDQNGDINSSLNDFTLQVFFVLSQITVQEIVSGTISGATWDILKQIIIKGWNKSKEKFLTKYSVNTSEKQNIKFGIRVNIDKNTHFNFHLRGDLDEKIILKSLDKTFDFIREQKTNSEYKSIDFVVFDKKTKTWKKIDVEKEIRKK